MQRDDYVGTLRWAPLLLATFVLNGSFATVPRNHNQVAFPDSGDATRVYYENGQHKRGRSSCSNDRRHQ